MGDNALEALRHFRGGNRAAAVGVTEAISVTLRQVERLPAREDKVLLMLGVMLFFVVAFQLLYAGLERIRRRLAAAP